MLAGPLISHFAYSANQGRTLIVYGMDYRNHIENVFLSTLNPFFNGLTIFQGHNGLTTIMCMQGLLDMMVKNDVMASQY